MDRILKEDWQDAKTLALLVKHLQDLRTFSIAYEGLGTNADERYKHNESGKRIAEVADTLERINAIKTPLLEMVNKQALEVLKTSVVCRPPLRVNSISVLFCS